MARNARIRGTRHRTTREPAAGIVATFPHISFFSGRGLRGPLAPMWNRHGQRGMGAMIRAKAALCCVVCGSVAILLGADAAVRDGSITPLADAAAFPDVGISGLPEAKLAALPETNVATFPDVNTGLPDTNSTAAAVTESASAA